MSCRHNAWRKYDGTRRKGRHWLPAKTRRQTPQGRSAIRWAASKQDRVSAGARTLCRPLQTKIVLESLSSFHAGLHISRLESDGHRRAPPQHPRLRLHERSAGAVSLNEARLAGPSRRSVNPASAPFIRERHADTFQSSACYNVIEPREHDPLRPGDTAR